MLFKRGGVSMTDDKKVFGKGFDVEITSFKELRAQAEAFDFNFYRKRMIGNLPTKCRYPSP